MPLPTNLYDLPLADMDVKEEPKRPKSVRLGQPRGRVTERNARLLAFIGMFPGADAEALSLLNISQKTATSEGGGLMSVRGTEQTLRKLYNLEALEKFRHAVTGTTSYGLSKLGFAYAREFDYELEHGASMNGISIERLRHYRMIALVAAQFASPIGYFKESLGIDPVGLDQLVTEHEMRAAFEPVKQGLRENKKRGKSNDYGKWRHEILVRSLNDVQEGRIEWSNLLEAHPVLYTIGYPRREESVLKPVHQPDLVVNLDRDRTKAAKNLLVEVELSKKSWENYDAILATLKAELDKPYVYKRAVYFTIGPGVETLMRKVDAAGDYGLFKSGKLVVLPICNRDGEPLQPTNRIRVEAK